ncbi:nucleotidyl transferase AbiEii/AbiGii toxin family protein [Chryseobacterium sp. NRRL B-14859]|uniref:nucleotidyl transferase AbiEii/AbiGii toxin family protein n=1 Tax=unclassified Chryseobacterium TaxID=2593645 RepID=UPI000F456A56|nr:nucleotidyl transferase AbiEii/AbiGii toxin family protein [Chryseobacterium sp. G0240]ROH98951.1 hypothetical protein EGI16_20590 [Chryseobacterium sp. G0240]
MSTSNQTYKELSIPHFKEVFEIIDSTMLMFNVPYYLIGANAIALHLLQQGIKPGRATKDIDFAIMITSITDFENIVSELEKYGFTKVEAPWTLYHSAYNIVIDLLPFGEIEQNSRVNFNEKFVDLHVLGFKEVLEKPNKIEIEEKITQIPSLPGMVILKLISWSDRPEERGNDLYDILKIIENYFMSNFDEIMDEHYDVLPDEEEEFDQLKIAARVLGRKAAEYIQNSAPVKKRIEETLENNAISPDTSEIARNWAQQKQWDLEYAHVLLENFKMGLFEINNKK